ncbi:MAG: hypothetical protein QOE08_679 [Thermoleophilaceae bacterium]|nr:hypothetical protein [Thermoleophilaceae bacterium]
MTGGLPPDDRSPAEIRFEQRQREREAKAGAKASKRPKAPKVPRVPQTPRARGESRVGRRIFAAAVVTAVVAILWFLNSLFQPFAGDGHGNVAVTIPKGTGVGKIGDLLSARGVIAHGFFFEVRATLAGKRGDLKPGSYTLKRDMSYGAVIDALSKGPASNLVTITIPEGKSRPEIQRLIAPDGLSGSYLKASRSSRLLDPRKLGGRHARDLEGFLFPATYQLRRGSAVSRLVAKQVAAFKSTLRQVSLRAARHVNLTTYDVVTIASLIEREAQLPRERRLIASVIYNRLRAGIPLGIDATTRFATGNWTKPLTGAQLRTSSPYNTRTNRGLPPGPIGNPGLASLRAAAGPARTKLLYYVVKPGTCGEHAFSSTFQQFQRDSARYDAARAARGGRSPARCGG